MKFAKEKLGKAFTELLAHEGMTSFLLNKLDNSKMSSFFTNKLDKSIIFDSYV
jgi:hypothetical protein